jgi:hypothetical protein
LAIDRASSTDDVAQDNGGRRANQYLEGSSSKGAAPMLGKGGAVLGAAAVCVLLAGGVGAAMAIEPGAAPVAPPSPSTKVVTVLDAPPPPGPAPAPAPAPTTTTAPAPAPQRLAPPVQPSGSGAATITVIINRPGG